jgi:hypothetical protein
MALTKLTKHIVYGATIVQCRYKDMTNLDTSATATTNWDSITLTPEYADSILEVRFSGTVSNNSDSSAPGGGTYDSPRCNLYMQINGQTEYTINDAASVGTFDYSYNSAAGRREGKSVNMFHRHLPGTTNLQTTVIQASRTNNNGGGNMQCRQGFLMVKEVAGGLTVGTPSNNYVN